MESGRWGRPWEVIRQSTINEGIVCYADLIPRLFHWLNFQSFSHPPLPCTEWETPLQMEISLINVNFPHKRAVSSFSEVSLCLLLFETNQLKILMPKTCFLGDGSSALYHISFLKFALLKFFIRNLRLDFSQQITGHHISSVMPIGQIFPPFLRCLKYPKILKEKFLTTLGNFVIC